MSFCQKYDLGFNSIGWTIHEEVLSSACGIPDKVDNLQTTSSSVSEQDRTKGAFGGYFAKIENIKRQSLIRVCRETPEKFLTYLTS